jgi:hypothetical protein
MDHLQTHPDSESPKCEKCEQKTSKHTILKHLVNCSGFGLFQCCYCRFGTNVFEVINAHIANIHPNCLPFFYERSVPTSAAKLNTQVWLTF